MAMNGGVGVDPGIRSGLAAVHATDDIGLLSNAIDIPTVGSGAAECVDVAAVRDWVQLHHPALALIERAQAMPRQGASNGFNRAVGSLEATIALCAIPLEIIEPTAWKRHFHLPGKDKERARQRALELFPAAHALLARKGDHGCAEAALIALYEVRLRHFHLLAAPSEPEEFCESGSAPGDPGTMMSKCGAPT
jgi:crossover junction endodeoxyribonuclease RuvC